MSEDQLSPEIVALAIPGAKPLWAAAIEADASRLTEIARAAAIDGWEPIEKIYGNYAIARGGRSRWRGAQLHYEARYGAPPLAVGRTGMATGRVGQKNVWWAAVDGLPLRHCGQIVVFSTVRRAQRAAVLGAAYLAWHRVFTLARAASLQAGELLKLSDQHDPVLSARGVAHLTPRYLATRHALGVDDELIMRGKINGVVTHSPLKALARATQELFGAILVADSEFYHGAIPSLTFYPEHYPGIDLAAAKRAIDRVLARLDELHDGDYERELRDEREELFAAVERGQALRPSSGAP